MYSSRRESLRAVPGIIRELKARGFRFVTVSELLALRSGS
jgi:peptidoglycan/xylan/chitin deacetylase (PgdA/CDA1 family)